MKIHRLIFTALILIPALTALAQDLRTCPEMPSGVHIRPDNRYFSVSPMIVPADKESTITIIPKFDNCRFKTNCTYELKYTPTERYAERSGWKPDVKTVIVPTDGKYKFTAYFEGEQEHIIYIEEIANENGKEKRRAFGTFQIYSLNDDLFALRPCKGDFHMHSNVSDGVESPGYVAGACRRAGLDWMTLSDHRKYQGSKMAQEAFAGLPVDLRIFNGEECHPPENPVHILSFGANDSVSACYADEAKYKAEVAQIQATLDVPPGTDPFILASCVWAAGKIRERQGLSMFCHPYWYTNHNFPPGGAITSALLGRRVFDAMEVISGMDSNTLASRDTNNLQIARWYEERANGHTIGICGISDAHGIERSDEFGRYYTVAFARSCELPDIIEAIKNVNSVAVQAVAGDYPEAHGPFRLVKYTNYLLREIFPQHDDLCYEEGRQMIEHVAGNAGAVDRLRLMKGQVARFYDACWGVK